jgi:hypothetical protein
MVDSTPDVCHVNQLTVILICVKPDGEIIEHFFFNRISHVWTSDENCLTNYWNAGIRYQELLRLEFRQRRQYIWQNSGLQARLKNESPTTLYIPRSSHSSHLFGNSAAESCQGAMKCLILFRKCMPNLVNPKYINSWKNNLPPIQNTVVICKEITTITCYQVSSRLVTFLKLIYAYVHVSNILICTVCLNLNNSLLQIFNFLSWKFY